MDIPYDDHAWSDEESSLTSDEIMSDCMSDDGSLSDESDDCPLRLRDPVQYFRELDNLVLKISEISMLKFYLKPTTNAAEHQSSYHFNIGLGHGTRETDVRTNEIQTWFEQAVEFANKANEASEVYATSIHQASSSATTHSSDTHDTLNIFGGPLRTMYHLVHCRNIIQWVLKSLEMMKQASYCENFISILIADKDQCNIAHLRSIQCEEIKTLATAFEICLTQLIHGHPSAMFFDPTMPFPELTNGCQNLLSGIGLNISPESSAADVWRCAVHVLDVAVLSYAGAHTRYFATTQLEYISLPGQPFLEKQYFVFRARSFLCLESFLGEEKACVLELIRPDTFQSDSAPSMYLSTDAAIFADIWGPVWKTCASDNGKADEDCILRYSVGNGMIIPWTSGPDDPVSSKEAVLCHFISGNDIGGSDTGEATGMILSPNSILMIGARIRLQYNDECNLLEDLAATRRVLKEADAISHFGTMRSRRVLDTEGIQVQVGVPHATIGVVRSYKRRGVTWKAAWTEEWKNNTKNQNVKILEHKFGLEVSACTFNARRRTFISILGSTTIRNYLGTWVWTSPECKEAFYTAISSRNYKDFRRQCWSQEKWRSELGDVITHCIDFLTPTGLSENCLRLRWVPDGNPGCEVKLEAPGHRWMGFLVDTEDCCTMAILDNKCLELPQKNRGRKCQSVDGIPRPSICVSTEENNNCSILETSFMLNQEAKPPEMHPKQIHSSNGHETSHKHGWSTSSLLSGTDFAFGENGRLRLVRPLGYGQILAEWSSSGPAVAYYNEIFRKNNHGEYIEPERDGAGPVYVLVRGSKQASMLSLHVAPSAYRTSQNGESSHTESYGQASDNTSRPRTNGGTASLDSTITTLWKDTTSGIVADFIAGSMKRKHKA